MACIGAANGATGSVMYSSPFLEVFQSVLDPPVLHFLIDQSLFLSRSLCYLNYGPKRHRRIHLSYIWRLVSLQFSTSESKSMVIDRLEPLQIEKQAKTCG